jgi:hypothetical protein
MLTLKHEALLWLRAIELIAFWDARLSPMGISTNTWSYSAAKAAGR